MSVGVCHRMHAHVSGMQVVYIYVCVCMLYLECVMCKLCLKALKDVKT